MYLESKDTMRTSSVRASKRAPTSYVCTLAPKSLYGQLESRSDLEAGPKGILVLTESDIKWGLISKLLMRAPLDSRYTQVRFNLVYSSVRKNCWQRIGWDNKKGHFFSISAMMHKRFGFLVRTRTHLALSLLKNLFNGLLTAADQNNKHHSVADLVTLAHYWDR